jgi:hypothetical protein
MANAPHWKSIFSHRPFEKSLGLSAWVGSYQARRFRISSIRFLVLQKGLTPDGFPREIFAEVGLYTALAESIFTL